jgi:hypothetical protein
VGSPRTGAGEVLVMELGSGSERTAAVSDVLARPERYFGEVGGAGHA